MSTASAKRFPQLKQGDIFFLENCAPLDDDNFKSRPVIVITQNSILKRNPERILIVAVSTKARNDFDRIEIPSTSTNPDCRTGLQRRSWAYPRWFLPVSRDCLINYLGTVPTNVLEQILVATEARTGIPLRPAKK